MTHSFQFDPNTILGVPSGASLQEIRDAYHQKSLKHHPDRGGDEWAFRMVVRAYEVLRTSTAIQEPVRWDRRQPDVTVVQAQTTDWSWMGDRSSTTREDATASPSETVGVKRQDSRT